MRSQKMKPETHLQARAVSAYAWLGLPATVEPGYSEVHKSDRSFHYSYYFTIARVKYMCVVETVRLVASV